MLYLYRKLHARVRGLFEVTLESFLQNGKCVLTSYTSSKKHFLKIFCILSKIRGHKKSDSYCQKETNPNNFPELKPVNSVICEQTFSFTNHYTNLKAMNGPRYNFFWIYILDLHNNYVEDPRVLKVNPLSSFRMDHILANMFEKINVK